MLPLLRRAPVPLFETPGGPGGEPPAPPADPPWGVFDAHYVQGLRQEAGANRVKARDAIPALTTVGEMLLRPS